MSAANPGLRPFTFLAGFAYYSLLGGRLDTALLLLFSALRSKQALADLVSDYINPQTLRRQLLLLPGFLLGFVILQICRFLLGLTKTGDSTKWTTPVRPLLIPCTTTHRRTFPEKHAFAYSYLVVGIPVGWRGTYAGMVSSGVEAPGWTSLFSVVPQPGKGWFDVNPADYLDRGNGHLGLRGKLDVYLESQGADPAQYPRAYLVTAARFMGYHFNPVSFWYLYSKDEELTAMVLEVNNTFGERRMYFLATDAIPSEQRLNGGDDTEKDASEPASKADEESAARKSTVRMTKQWPKDFHVSPFNSRKGAYSLLATDFFSPDARGAYTLDNTITLKSSKDHPKIVARLFNSAPAIDPGSMSPLQKLAFLCRWWWVGFVTFPRIVKEAAVLFFSRRLHVWYRPEPLKESMGRQADATESRLEPIFRAYLRHLVEKSAAAIAVRYIPAGIDSAGPEVMQSPAAKKNPKRTEELDFKVLTPAFYTRFVHYAHDLEAVCCEFQDNSTIWISRPDLLPKLILKKPTPPLKTTNILDFVYFRAIRALRQRPERIERPLTSAASPSEGGRDGADSVQKVDIRDFRISSMDGFVLGHSDMQTRSAYRSLVLRTFLANRLALGSVELLGLQHFILRAGIAWVLSSLVAPLVKV
ncbi:dna-binding wrky domain-containing protein [Colletotrichum incanum]|uniref:Dna-binding wrky domain-containing protein n=1 Tax=Colletotrichum incanum TaxID=1573173 RepID=A0A166TJR3_COLIC|nr:dna-binding wrky domain-containing protein [Colletotrichum incanum]OHW94506.1 DNA-binding wrky domain-containing protein [Colletotrichum incanum]